MNRLVIIISTFLVLTSCGQSKNNDQKEKQKEKSENFNCNEFDFNSAKQQADSLLVFYNKAVDSSLTNRIDWENKFFCAFPNSFKGMQALFGYDNNIGEAPLYNYPIGANVIHYFSQLKSIPDSLYYDKYIRININGNWEADNIGEAFGFHYILINETKAASEILENFDDEEIRSVFRFIFDGPHPKNEHNEETFQTLKPKIEEQSERLGNLLFQAYATMMAEDDGHGH